MIPGKTYTPADYIRILIRHRYAAVLPCVLVTIATLAVLHWIPNKYQSDTLLLFVPQRVPETYVKATVTTKLEDRLSSVTQQILSRTRLERIIQQFDLYPRERSGGVMDSAVARMRSDIIVQAVKGDAFRISYVARDPELAKAVTAGIASLFVEENAKDREVIADATNQFLDTQLEDSRARLEEHERTLEAYRRRYASELPTQLSSNLQAVQTTMSQAQTIVDSLNRDRDQLLVVERSLANASQPGPDEALPTPTAGAPGAPISAESQLEQAEATLRDLQARYLAAHPDVIRAARVVDALRLKVKTAPPPDSAEAALPLAVNQARAARLKRLHDLETERDLLNRQIAEKQSRQHALDSDIAMYQSRAAAAPTRESELVALTRDYDTLRKVYSDLLAKREESKVAANLERRQISEQFTILDAAQRPDKPFSPNRPLLSAAGAVAGLLLGLGLVVLLEYFDGRLRTEQDVVAALQLPVLALVPREDKAAAKPAPAHDTWALSLTQP